jgi:Secretion system C-terminal sorting domain
MRFSRSVLLALLSAGLTTAAFGQLGGFVRSDTVSVPFTENTGFGDFISGVDFDGDNNVEIYAVNNNWTDTGNEVIPRIYKFEKHGSQWDSVWSATMDIPLQNTWPALTYGDWDQDGRMEIIWGPSNNLNATTNPNPARIIVFEYPGDGSDNMGVPDGSGGFVPNTSWTITAQDNFELRPIRWFLHDLDHDGTLELIFASRVAGHRYGVVQVTDIPDGGPGFEGWTLVSSGLDFAANQIDPGTIYDLAIVDSSFYLFHDNGNVTPVHYNNGVFSVGPIQANLIPGGSWKSASVVDLDNNGTKEIVVGSWQIAGPGNDQNVYLLQQEGDTLKRTTIANLTSLMGSTGRFNGSNYGDVDNDGMLDFAFGGRETIPNAQVIRLRYKGGSITDPSSYEGSTIDQEFGTNVRNWDLINVSNVDADPDDEVLYSGGLDGRIPVVILDRTTTSVSGDATRPVSFTLEQNFPNPFNPVTTIRFTLTAAGRTTLTVYDILGKEVSTITDEQLPAGSYSVNFDGSHLASGTYIYSLTTSGRRDSRKMVLTK